MQASIDIPWWLLATFMLVLIVPLAINRHFQLRLGKDISVAVTRMTLQLILVGLYLELLFQLNSLFLNIIWLSIMLAVGASAIIGSAKLPKRLLYLPVLAGLCLGLAPLIAILLLLILTPSPFYNAQYLIPLAGMLLGNSLSGNIIALNQLFSALDERKMEYEGALALGASAYQSAFPFIQTALKNSLAPILASMMTTGLVTLPGMMTGQILGGSDPMTAIKYQLIILIAIFVMLSISVSTTLLLAVNSCISKAGQVQAKVSN